MGAAKPCTNIECLDHVPYFLTLFHKVDTMSGGFSETNIKK